MEEGEQSSCFTLSIKQNGYMLTKRTHKKVSPVESLLRSDYILTLETNPESFQVLNKLHLWHPEATKTVLSEIYTAVQKALGDHLQKVGENSREERDLLQWINPMLSSTKNVNKLLVYRDNSLAWLLKHTKRFIVFNFEVREDGQYSLERIRWSKYTLQAAPSQSVPFNLPLTLPETHITELFKVLCTPLQPPASSFVEIQAPEESPATGSTLASDRSGEPPGLEKAWGEVIPAQTSNDVSRPQIFNIVSEILRILEDLKTGFHQDDQRLVSDACTAFNQQNPLKVHTHPAVKSIQWINSKEQQSGFSLIIYYDHLRLKRHSTGMFRKVPRGKDETLDQLLVQLTLLRQAYVNQIPIILGSLKVAFNHYYSEQRKTNHLQIQQYEILRYIAGNVQARLFQAKSNWELVVYPDNTLGFLILQAHRQQFKFMCKIKGERQYSLLSIQCKDIVIDNINQPFETPEPDTGTRSSSIATWSAILDEKPQESHVDGVEEDLGLVHEPQTIWPLTYTDSGNQPNVTGMDPRHPPLRQVLVAEAFPQYGGYHPQNPAGYTCSYPEQTDVAGETGEVYPYHDGTQDPAADTPFWSGQTDVDLLGTEAFDHYHDDTQVTYPHTGSWSWHPDATSDPITDGYDPLPSHGNDFDQACEEAVRTADKLLVALGILVPKVPKTCLPRYSII
jgi:hypothetical protein